MITDKQRGLVLQALELMRQADRLLDQVLKERSVPVDPNNLDVPDETFWEELETAESNLEDVVSDLNSALLDVSL